MENEIMTADRTIEPESRLHTVSRIVKMDEDKREIRHVISTARLDRCGRYIEVGGWQLGEYRKNNVVVANHDYDIEKLIGNGVDVAVVKDELQATTVFGPEALGPLAFRLVQSGMAKAWSVGWKGVKGHSIGQGVQDACKTCEDLASKTDWGYHYVKQSLFEYSLVAVPANPDAVMRLQAAGFPISKTERDLWIESFGTEHAHAETQAEKPVTAAAPDGANADEVPVTVPARSPEFYAGLFGLTRTIHRRNMARAATTNFGHKE